MALYCSHCQTYFNPHDPSKVIGCDCEGAKAERSKFMTDQLDKMKIRQAKERVMDTRTAAKKILLSLPRSLAEMNRQDPEAKAPHHAVWMLWEIVDHRVQLDKAHRWLGYAQALLVVHGFATLEEMKQVNVNS